MNSKEFYNSLSEDVKAKIKACKSEAEMMRVLDEEKIELEPELLDEVSGGGMTCMHGHVSCNCNLDC